MRFVIVGAGGFLGKNLYNFLSRSGYPVVGLGRAEIDFTAPSSFRKLELADGDILLDCVSRIDGDAEEILRVNQQGLENFIGYINAQRRDFSYIYFSTYSTLLESYVNSSAYVKSKFLAEKHVRENVAKYKILRLVFPFGKGEGKNRLISRLINKFKSGEPVSIERLTLNLTPITQILTNFERILRHPSAEINFSNEFVFYLPDVASYIARQLGISNGYSVVDKQSNLSVVSSIKIAATEEEVWKEIAAMIYE